MSRRHALLDREFDLNMPAAPSIYEGVVPVVRRLDGSLAQGGRGTPLEWVLVMTRFSTEAEQSRIAAERGIDGLVRTPGASVARYHPAAVRDTDGATTMADILDEFERVFGEFGNAVSPEGPVVLSQYRAAWRARVATLRHRTTAGHVRRCHGDLHQRNIMLIDSISTPCDALQFDEQLNICDTLYDLAFVLMDLDQMAMPHATTLVLNAYLLEMEAIRARPACRSCRSICRSGRRSGRWWLCRPRSQTKTAPKGAMRRPAFGERGSTAANRTRPTWIAPWSDSNPCRIPAG